MLVDRLDQNLPAAYPMAEFALCPISAPVNVGMAILAIAAYIREYRMDVAFLATHSRVQAAQWITGSAVIEIRLSADRFPCRRGVTVLAGHLHRTMRTVIRRSG